MMQLALRRGNLMAVTKLYSGSYIRDPSHDQRFGGCGRTATLRPLIVQVETLEVHAETTRNLEDKPLEDGQGRGREHWDLCERGSVIKLL